MAETIYKVSIAGVEASISTMKELEQAVKDLTIAKNKLNLVTEGATRTAITNEITALKNLQQQYNVNNVALKNTATAGGNAGVAMQNLNYVVRDSPYFFQNFNLGVMAVGNNLNPLIDSFSRLKQQAAAMNAENIALGNTTAKTVTAFGLLKQSMMGVGGVLFGFSILVTVLQAVSFAMAKGGSKSDDFAGQIKDLWSEAYQATRKFDDFVTSLEKMSASDIKESIRALTERFTEMSEPSIWQRLIFGSTVFTRNLQEMLQAQKELKALRDADKKPKEGVIGGGIIEEQQALVDSYNILLKSAKIDSERLGWLKLRNEAQAKLDLLEGKGLKGHSEKVKEIKDYWDQIVKLEHEYIAWLNLQNERERENAQKGGMDRSGVSKGLRPNEAIDKFPKDLDAVKDKLKLIEGVANTAGDAIPNAFLSGKNMIEAATQALIEFAVRLATVSVIKMILAPLTGGASMALANGGIIPEANNGLIAGNSYSGDKILARLNSGEMVLNRAQQASLFKQINGGGGKQVIEVRGKISTNRNKFVVDIENARDYVNNNQKLVTIGRD